MLLLFENIKEKVEKIMAVLPSLRDYILEHIST